MKNELETLFFSGELLYNRDIIPYLTTDTKKFCQNVLFGHRLNVSQAPFLFTAASLILYGNSDPRCSEGSRKVCQSTLTSLFEVQSQKLKALNTELQNYFKNVELKKESDIVIANLLAKFFEEHASDYGNCFVEKPKEFLQSVTANVIVFCQDKLFRSELEACADLLYKGDASHKEKYLSFFPAAEIRFMEFAGLEDSIKAAQKLYRTEEKIYQHILIENEFDMAVYPYIEEYRSKISIGMKVYFIKKDAELPNVVRLDNGIVAVRGSADSIMKFVTLETNGFGYYSRRANEQEIPGIDVVRNTKNIPKLPTLSI